MVHKSASTRALQLLSLALATAALVGCSGGNSTDVAPPPEQPPPPPPLTRQEAVQQTATQNAQCTTLGPFYWEIGDATGLRGSGRVGADAPQRDTQLWVYSSSKWMYAAYVAERHNGVNANDVPYLNFTSGHGEFGNLPVCLLDETVDSCLVLRDGFEANEVGQFKYDSGHMQYHASNFMGLGNATNTALAQAMNDTLGNLGIAYEVPQLAAGVRITSGNYATFLQRMLRGEYKLAAQLGSSKVCANPGTASCNAIEAPAMPADEGLNYSLGHWVEDDPEHGDHAFSSAGGGGFYPWINSAKTLYGILAREAPDATDPAGFSSLQCGRLLRQAWITAKVVTTAVPTP